MQIDALSARRGWLALLLSLALVRGLIYLSVIPPWQSPDETGHFEYAWLVAHLGRLPTASDLSVSFERELLGSLYEWRYGEFITRPLPEQMPARLGDLPQHILVRTSRTAPERFSLSYLWMALLIWPVRHQDLVVQLYTARLASVLLQLGIIWLAWRTLEQVYPARAGPVAAMTALIVFIPQHTFINAAAGDGPMAELMACLVLYGWVRVFCRGWTLWEAVWIPLCTLAGIWSKGTALFLLPLNAALMVWWLFRWRKWTWRSTILVAAGIAALVPLSWLLARSWSGAEAVNYLRTALEPNTATWTDPRGLTLGDALLASFESFWAYFGWMAVPASSRWQGVILVLSAAAALGWVLKSQKEASSWAVLMMVGAFGTALAIFVWTMLLFPSEGYYQFQGRYLFPVVIPIAFLLVRGWMRVFAGQHSLVWVGAGVTLVVLFDAWCMFGTVVPYFYF